MLFALQVTQPGLQFGVAQILRDAHNANTDVCVAIVPFNDGHCRALPRDDFLQFSARRPENDFFSNQLFPT